MKVLNRSVLTEIQAQSVSCATPDAETNLGRVNTLNGAGSTVLIVSTMMVTTFYNTCGSYSTTTTSAAITTTTTTID